MEDQRHTPTKISVQYPPPPPRAENVKQLLES